MQLSGRSLGTSGELFKDNVVRADRIVIVVQAVSNLAQIELSAAGEGVRRIVLDDILKFAGRQRILSRVEVGKRRLVGLLERGRRVHRRASARSIRSAAR